MNIEVKEKRPTVVLRAKPTTFSLHEKFDATGAEHTFEWRWPDGKPCWNKATREDKSVSTDYDGPLREENTEALLKLFGLQRYADAPSFEELRVMSPYRLIKLRRIREDDEDLEPLKVESARSDAVLAELAL